MRTSINPYKSFKISSLRPPSGYAGELTPIWFSLKRLAPGRPEDPKVTVPNSAGGEPADQPLAVEVFQRHSLPPSTFLYYIFLHISFDLQQRQQNAVDLNATANAAAANAAVNTEAKAANTKATDAKAATTQDEANADNADPADSADPDDPANSADPADPADPADQANPATMFRN